METKGWINSRLMEAMSQIIRVICRKAQISRVACYHTMNCFVYDNAKFKLDLLWKV